MSDVKRYFTDCNNLRLVSKPGDECDVRVVLASDYAALEAELARLRARQETDEYPPCDYCGVVTDYHPWHGSGLIDGRESPHIHACNGCRHLLPSTPQPSTVVTEVTVPDEWRLVPVEPTVGMLDIAVSHALAVSLSRDYDWSAYMRDVWMRMVEASLEPGK